MLVLAMLVLAIPPLVIMVLVLLLVALMAMGVTVAANKERCALATGASMASTRTKRGQMRSDIAS
jgi:hypothetical protein